MRRTLHTRIQRGVAAPTIVLDFFGRFACRKALGVALVRHELCDGESNALQVSGMRSTLGFNVQSSRTNEILAKKQDFEEQQSKGIVFPWCRLLLLTGSETSEKSMPKLQMVQMCSQGAAYGDCRSLRFLYV